MIINSLCRYSTKNLFTEPVPHEFCWNVGVEVELENVHIYPSGWVHQKEGYVLDSHAGWVRVNDNSLRASGMEFKFDGPAAGRKVANRLDSLYKAITTSDWRASCRTGIHVHIDVRGLELEAVTAILTAYSLMEPYLFAYVGEDRESNIFTVPWYRSYTDAERWDELVKYSTQYGDKRNLGSAMNQKIVRGACKYSALNYATLARFGSLEFRHAPTWLSKQDTATWIAILCAITRYAYSRDPNAIIDRWAGMGPRAFCREVLGKHFTAVANKVPSFTALADDSQCESIAEKVAGVCTYKAKAWEPPLREATKGSKFSYPFRRTRSGLIQGGFDIPNPLRGGYGQPEAPVDPATQAGLARVRTAGNRARPRRPGANTGAWTTAAELFGRDITINEEGD